MQTRRYVFDGREVPVETWGSSPETLVFLPGLGCHPLYYRPGLAGLAERFRVLVPDLSFRTHRTLPESPEDYLALVSSLADELAPGAVWAGHSFGALVALLREGPAIACAPSVPAPISMGRYFGRAVWLQAREYLGLEGWIGVRYAPRIMVDYLATAALRPGTLFPSVASIRGEADLWRPVCRTGVVYLCERDELYRTCEYEAYFEGDAAPGLHIERLDDAHDWPITRPERFVRRMMEAYHRLRPAVRAGSA